mgnify:CR=1 FL=1
MIFTIHYALPAHFSFEGGDLHYTYMITLQEWSHPHPISLETPLGHVVELPFPTVALPATYTIEGEGVPLTGHPVRCEGFFVTNSHRKDDWRNRACDEKLPQYLDGYCLCDGRQVFVKNVSGQLLTCFDPSKSVQPVESRTLRNSLSWRFDCNLPFRKRARAMKCFLKT